MKLTDIKYNPKNPRIIKDEKFAKLVKSLQDFPEMMDKRPMICVTDTDGKIYPLGGNMRLRAIHELKFKEIPDTWVLLADEWTEEQRQEFIIKDNVGFGEWDWDALANEWDDGKLDDWGLDLPDYEDLTGKDYIDESENFDLEQAKELDFYDEFIIIKFKDESEYLSFLSEFNIKNVQTSNMKNGKDIRTSIKKVFDYEDLHSIIK